MNLVKLNKRLKQELNQSSASSIGKEGRVRHIGMLDARDIRDHPSGKSFFYMCCRVLNSLVVTLRLRGSIVTSRAVNRTIGTLMFLLVGMPGANAQAQNKSPQRADVDCASEPEAEEFAIEVTEAFGDLLLSGQISAGLIDVYFGELPPGTAGQSWSDDDGPGVIVIPRDATPWTCGITIIHEGHHLNGGPSTVPTDDEEKCVEERRAKQATADDIVVHTQTTGEYFPCDELTRLENEAALYDVTCCCDGEGPFNPMPLGVEFAEIPCS